MDGSDPSEWPAEHFDALALREEGRFDAALAGFSDLMDVDDPDVQVAAATHRASTLELMGREGEALAAFGAAIERYGRTTTEQGQYYVANCLSHQVHILIRLGKADEARATIERLVQAYGRVTYPLTRAVVQETAGYRTRLPLRGRLYLWYLRRRGRR